MPSNRRSSTSRPSGPAPGSRGHQGGSARPVWQDASFSEVAARTCINAARSAVGDAASGSADQDAAPQRLRFVGTVGRKLEPGNIRPARLTVRRPLPLPDRPSIAVLPFANMSDDPDQEYFADGMSEDLITGLSRIRWLFVIARNSTFVYKNRAVDVKQVSRELGVRYVLEGSVRRAGNRLRISAQLIDATDRWPSLGRAIRPRARRHLRRAGRNHPQRRGRDRTSPAGRGGRSRAVAFAGDLGAWELVARAQTHVWRLTRSTMRRRSTRSSGPSRPIRTTRRREACLGFCLVFAAHMGWIDRDQGLLPGPRARHSGDCAR